MIVVVVVVVRACVDDVRGLLTQHRVSLFSLLGIVVFSPSSQKRVFKIIRLVTVFFFLLVLVKMIKMKLKNKY